METGSKRKWLEVFNYHMHNNNSSEMQFPPKLKINTNISTVHVQSVPREKKKQFWIRSFHTFFLCDDKSFIVSIENSLICLSGWTPTALMKGLPPSTCCKDVFPSVEGVIESSTAVVGLCWKRPAVFRWRASVRCHIYLQSKSKTKKLIVLYCVSAANSFDVAGDCFALQVKVHVQLVTP